MPVPILAMGTATSAAMTPPSTTTTGTSTPTSGPTVAEPSVVAAPTCEMSRHTVFAECPQCGGGMAPEHAHYRCTGCGWRDSCCD